MFEHPLSLPLRASVTVTTLALLLVSVRALTRTESGSRRGAWVYALFAAFGVAAFVAHADGLRGFVARVFPVGVALGIGTAVASLASPSARRRFDSLRDRDVRAMLSFRAVYGSMLFGLAALGHFPVSFALDAGLGDLLVGWLALTLPVSLAVSGPRWGRALLHGIGLADLAMVLFAAVTAVRPWSHAHGDAANMMTLPWVAVPLMFATNLHGVRQAWFSRGNQPARDRSEPAGGVPGAVSRT